MDGEPPIGQHIKDVRTSKGWSQAVLSKKTGISPTSLSSYETGKKIPGLQTLAKIASAMDVSLDCLYYGNEAEALLNSSIDVGELVANCIFALWKHRVIDINASAKDSTGASTIVLGSHRFAVKRLIKNISEFEANRSTYADPDGYLGQIKNSIATEINQGIAAWGR